MTMGYKDHFSILNIRWFEGLPWQCFLIAGEIWINQNSMFVGFNPKTSRAKPCEFHAVTFTHLLIKTPPLNLRNRVFHLQSQ